MEPTTTSEDIIQYLKSQGIELTPEQKKYVRGKVHGAIIMAAGYSSNGCDCGQMSCVICHG